MPFYFTGLISVTNYDGLILAQSKSWRIPYFSPSRDYELKIHAIPAILPNWSEEIKSGTAPDVILQKIRNAVEQQTQHCKQYSNIFYQDNPKENVNSVSINSMLIVCPSVSQVNSFPDTHLDNVQFHGSKQEEQIKWDNFEHCN